MRDEEAAKDGRDGRGRASEWVGSVAAFAVASAIHTWLTRLRLGQTHRPYMVLAEQALFTSVVSWGLVLKGIVVAAKLTTHDRVSVAAIATAWWASIALSLLAEGQTAPATAAVVRSLIVVLVVLEFKFSFGGASPATNASPVRSVLAKLRNHPYELLGWAAITGGVVMSGSVGGLSFDSTGLGLALTGVATGLVTTKLVATSTVLRSGHLNATDILVHVSPILGVVALASAVVSGEVSSLSEYQAEWWQVIGGGVAVGAVELVQLESLRRIRPIDGAIVIALRQFLWVFTTVLNVHGRAIRDSAEKIA